MALLPVHSQNFASLRKNSFKTACRRTVAKSEPVRYRGQVLTPRPLRRTGNCPPLRRKELTAQPNNSSARGTASSRAGKQVCNLRIMSWNAGHLGQQKWGELRTWLAAEADRHCDILVLQETHWNESSEFRVSGWYCVSSASASEPNSLRQLLPGASHAGILRTDHQPLGLMES